MAFHLNHHSGEHHKQLDQGTRVTSPVVLSARTLGLHVTASSNEEASVAYASIYLRERKHRSQVEKYKRGSKKRVYNLTREGRSQPFGTLHHAQQHHIVQASSEDQFTQRKHHVKQLDLTQKRLDLVSIVNEFREDKEWVKPNFLVYVLYQRLRLCRDFEDDLENLNIMCRVSKR